jgi:hypothetical protein
MLVGPGGIRPRLNPWILKRLTLVHVPLGDALDHGFQGMDLASAPIAFSEPRNWQQGNLT